MNEAPGTSNARDTLRVLIVDDHALFRHGLRQVIDEQPDMTVVGEAVDGAEAVRMARALRPHQLDLVLMDIDMPGVDGIQATAQITAEDPELPIVMLTVSSLDRDLFEAVRAGAMGYISKSLLPDALVRSLRGFHRGESIPLPPHTAQKVLAYFLQGGSARAPEPPPELTLSAREREVLEMIARGDRDRDIAARFGLAQSTVKKHVQHILRKLHARNRTEAVARLRG